MWQSKRDSGFPTSHWTSEAAGALTAWNVASALPSLAQFDIFLFFLKSLGASPILPAFNCLTVQETLHFTATVKQQRPYSCGKHVFAFPEKLPSLR